MPTYEYACKQCAEHLEVVQKFTDDALTTCPSCGGTLRKVFGAVGISFKGSGFYKTDSRGGSAKANGTGTSESTTPSADTSSTPKDTPAPKADTAKPAATTGSAAAS